MDQVICHMFRTDQLLLQNESVDEYRWVDQFKARHAYRVALGACNGNAQTGLAVPRTVYAPDGQSHIVVGPLHLMKSRTDNI